MTHSLCVNCRGHIGEWLAFRRALMAYLNAEMEKRDGISDHNIGGMLSPEQLNEFDLWAEGLFHARAEKERTEP